MFQSQHAFSTFDSQDDSYASQHSSYNGGAPDRMYGSSYSQSLRSGSSVNMYASGRAAAAPAPDQGGCVFVRASKRSHLQTSCSCCHAATRSPEFCPFVLLRSMLYALCLRPSLCHTPTPFPSYASHRSAVKCLSLQLASSGPHDAALLTFFFRYGVVSGQTSSSKASHVSAFASSPHPLLNYSTPIRAIDLSLVCSNFGHLCTFLLFST
jgi:hypothetical protein